MTHLARKGALAAAVCMGALLGAGSSGYSQIIRYDQCYYRPGIDPENWCAACADSCLGEGYRCCKIVTQT